MRIQGCRLAGCLLLLAACDSGSIKSHCTDATPCVGELDIGFGDVGDAALVDISATVGGSLTIMPALQTLPTTTSQTLGASGGIAPYHFAIVVGAGTLTVATDHSVVFQPPSISASSVVQVTDADANTAIAYLTYWAPLAIAPTAKTLGFGATQNFTASGGLSPYTFLLASGLGTVGTDGTYTAPTQATDAVVEVTDALHNSATAEVTIVLQPPLEIVPTVKTLAVTHTFQFVADDGVEPYTFSVLSGGGSIDQNGYYTAPSTSGSAIVKVVDAASHSATATVTINPTLSITPATDTLQINGIRTYVVHGGTPPSNFSTDVGTVDPVTGVFQAPNTTGTAMVTATDADGTTATATVTISAMPVMLAIFPTAFTLAVNNTKTFIASGGAGGYVYSADIGTINAATGVFAAPGVAGSGTITLTDADNHTITAMVTVNPALVLTPTNKTLDVGDNFSLSTSGGVAPVTIYINAGLGTLSANTYTAPGSSGAATITAIDAVGNTKTCAVTIAGVVSISPLSKTLAPGNSVTFTASGGIVPYTYAAATGTVGTTTGAYTAPSSPGSDMVTVTDAANHTATATLTINPALTVTPSAVNLTINDRFSPTVSGGSPPYIYSVQSGTGSIDASAGVYTASSSAGSAIIRVVDALGNVGTVNVTVKTFSTVDDYQLAASQTATANTALIGASDALFVGGFAKDSVAVSHWITRKSTDHGVTYSTVDDFNYVSGQHAAVQGLAFDGTSILYAAGYGRDATGFAHWVVRKSTDVGTTWTTFDDYQLAASKDAVANGITVLASGDVFAAGYGYDGSSNQHWIVRKYTSGAWSTVDDFRFSSANSYANGIAHDSAGNLFVVGNGSGAGYYVARKGLSGGTSWSTSDQTPQYHANEGATAIVVDSFGTVYSVGSQDSNNGAPACNLSPGAEDWYLRDSTNSGGTWAWLEAVKYNSCGATTSSPRSASVSSLGDLFVGGLGRDTSNINHWWVRKRRKTDGFIYTVDDYQYTTAKAATSFGTAVDSSGRVFTVGGADDSSSVTHWIVRRIEF